MGCDFFLFFFFFMSGKNFGKLVWSRISIKLDCRLCHLGMMVDATEHTLSTSSFYSTQEYGDSVVN